MTDHGGGSSGLNADIWAESEQILSILRRPEKWFERISETVRVVDDELERTVRMTLFDRLPVKSTSSLIVAIQSPRKGIPVDATPGGHSAGSQALSHQEHIAISRMMVLFRFRTVLRLGLSRKRISENKAVWAEETGNRLLELVDSTDMLANEKTLHELFTRRGRLRGLPKGEKGSSLRDEMENLYLLAQTVAERYFKFVRIHVGGGGKAVLEYSYAQEREARDYGVRVVRILRRWFRAPKSLLFIHAPLARLSEHYELRLEPIEGYYVRQQFALMSSRQPNSRDVEDLGPADPDNSKDIVDEPWMSTRRGGWTSGFVFIANGHTAKTRIYAAFRLLEIPPGATGRAWAGSVLGSLVLVSVIAWSLTHNSPASLVAPEILLALVAAGAAVLDNTMPTRQVFNSPFLPRFVLFFQTVLALVASVWLLVRSSANTLFPFAAWMSPLWSVMIDLTIGIAIAVASVVLTGGISRRTMQAAKTYDAAMLDKKQD